MARPSHRMLARFPELKTRELAAAQEVTARFWPKHTSAVLGPDDYAVEMNRVLLGHVAVTYVACTSRIRVISAAPAAEYALYLPFAGSIQIVADGLELTASIERPLLRGPTRTFVFESSPIRCLVIDIPSAVLVAAMGSHADAPWHASIAAPHATSLVRLAVQLAKAADRSRSLVQLQRLTFRDRLTRLPKEVRRQEDMVVSLVARAVAEQSEEGRACDVESLKAWLSAHAHRRVRMCELAARSGVSLRTVERAFLRTGMTPLDYVRQVRLNRARTILAGPMKNVTVADVAAAVGYTHLGRFADEYRRHVGELPSQTLARCRS